MSKLKSTVQRVMVAGVILFFVWIAASWWEIGLGDPLERPDAGRYNAFVVLAGREPIEEAAAHRAAAA